MGRRNGVDRGDIVRVSLNPTVGRELQAEMRPVLVLSTREFDALIGTAGKKMAASGIRVERAAMRRSSTSPGIRRRESSSGIEFGGGGLFRATC